MHTFLQQLQAVVPFSNTRSGGLALCLAVSIAAWCTTGMAATGGSVQAEPHGELALQQVTGNLYRFSRIDQAAPGQSGVLLVGSKAALVGNPLDLQTASSLDKLIKEKFGVPVTFVFYTHASENRGAGARVFIEQGATLVAHANSVHSRSVSDGAVPAASMVFEQTLTLNLLDSWGKDQAERVTLRYLGRSATDDMIVAHFPQHDAVFASDFVSVESLPLFPLDKGFFPDWFAAIDKLNRIDYSYFLPGHGNIGIRADAIEHGHYLRELHNRVTRQLQRGLGEEQIVKDTGLQRYRQWQHFDEMATENVRAMIKAVSGALPDNN